MTKVIKSVDRSIKYLLNLRVSSAIDQAIQPTHLAHVGVTGILLTIASVTEPLANGKTHRHSSHTAKDWNAERDFGHGWGWDESVGYYEGPIWDRKGRGYFRCFHPLYGWRLCSSD